MKNWKVIAAANGFGIPEAEIERIAPPDYNRFCGGSQ